MIEFLTENWKLITILGAILIELILVLIFKKRPTVVDSSFYSNLCIWIEEAENKYGGSSGVNKMAYVLTRAKEEFGDYFNEARVREVVEWILTLPKKKEK